MSTDAMPNLFVQCPSCRCTGHHVFELRLFEVMTVPDAQGDPIECPAFEDPPRGTPVIDRTCCFCRHRWTSVR